jgi:hypothetical protein
MYRLLPALLLALLALAPAARAQSDSTYTVTLREAFEISQDSLQFISDNLATLDADRIESILESPFADSTIRFTAVLLSDPLNSGQASYNTTDRRVGRVHVWMRDTSAVQNGQLLPGYTAQIVDGSYETTGLANLGIGAVVTVTGVVDYFGTGAQITPTTIEVVAQDLVNIGLSEMLLDPISLDLDDVAVEGVDEDDANFDQSAFNALNYNLYAYEYARFENLTVSNTATFQSGTRFNISFVDADDLTLDFQGYSLNFRNDRGEDYRNAGFNVPAEPFSPPLIGATVNVQGFLLPSTGDFTNRYNPDYKLEILPFAKDDLEVTSASIGDAEIGGILDADTDLEISVPVVAASGGSIQSVTFDYTVVSRDGTETDPTSLALTPSGDLYTGTLDEGALVPDTYLSYSITATDSEGETVSTVPSVAYIITGGDRVDAISEIRSIAQDSPADELNLNSIAITAVVMSNPGASGILSIQDDPDLDAGTGLFLTPSSTTASLNQGDQVTITAGTLVDDFGVPTLQDITFEVAGSGDPYPYKVVSTATLQDAAAAEAHVGMALRFNDVTVISTNPDDPRDFGEFVIASDGDTSGLRVDDESEAISSDYNDGLVEGATFDFVRGILNFSFGNYKLLPETAADLDGLSTSADGPRETASFVLEAVRPNPAKGAARVAFTVKQSARVTLSVYDLLGRRALVVADEVMPAGDGSRTIDTSTLSAGLYLVRLQSGADAATQRLVVLR